MVIGQNLGGHKLMPMGDYENVFTIQYMCVLCSDYHVLLFFVTQRTNLIYNHSSQNISKNQITGPKTTGFSLSKGSQVSRSSWPVQ
jgi:hypothetical protein